MSRTEYALLGVLLLAYLALGALFAVRTPPWQAPDEPAHYNYVRQLVEGQLPVIEPGDWDQAYLGQIVGAEFAPAYPVDEIAYEDWQPPLYYLLQAPVYRLTGGSLTAMRLLSVALGAGVVALAYVVGRAVFGRVAPALAVAAFVAFLPQHLAILGSVNNDALSELIIAAILALLVTPWPEAPPLSPPEGGRAERRRLLAIGLLLGVGFLTKGQAYLMAPVVGVFLLVRYWRDRPDRLPQPVRSITSALLWVYIPALLLGLHIAYNLTFVQHQGRYLYPALIPIAVGFVAGLGYWLRPLGRRRPWAEWLLPVGLAGLLVGIALFALLRIIPSLAPG